MKRILSIYVGNLRPVVALAVFSIFLIAITLPLKVYAQSAEMSNNPSLVCPEGGIFQYTSTKGFFCQSNPLSSFGCLPGDLYSRITGKPCLGQYTAVPTIPPVISYLSPSTGPIATPVTITGANFDPTKNYVLLNGLSVNDSVPIPSSSNGTSITFAIPKTVLPLCDPFGSAGNCSGTTTAIHSGSYNITVETINGKSKPVVFTTTETKSSVPSTPTDVFAFPGKQCGGKVLIKWDPVSGAIKYHILRATALMGPYYELTNSPTATTTISDVYPNSFKHLFYKVSASNSSGTSAESSPTETLPSQTCQSSGALNGIGDANAGVSDGNTGGTGYSWGNNEYGGSVNYINDGTTVNGWSGQGEPPYIHHDINGNVVVPWLTFTVDTFVNNGFVSTTTRLYYSFTDNGGGLKVPEVVDGEWDGKTYYWLYPVDSDENTAKVNGLLQPDPNAIPEIITINGNIYEVWTAGIASGYPQSGFMIRAPEFIQGQIVGGTGSDVGPGTDYPVGLTFDEMMKWFWRTKDWSVNFAADIQALRGTYLYGPSDYMSDSKSGLLGISTLNSNFQSFTSDPRTSEADLGVGQLFSYHPDLSTDFTCFDSGTVTCSRTVDNTSENSVFGDFRISASPVLSTNYGGSTNVIHNGNLYYPNLTVDATPNGTDSDVMTSKTCFLCAPSPNGFGTSELTQTFANHSLTFYYPGKYEIVNDYNFNVTPKSYWTYNGKYDPTTGDPVPNPDISMNSGGFLDNIFASASSLLNNIASENNTASAILSWFHLLPNSQLAAATPPSQGLTFASKHPWRLTYFGGEQDVRINSNGDAYEHDNDNNCNFQTLAHYQTGDDIPAGSKVGDLVYFPQGSVKGCIGYHEKGSVSGKFMNSYDRVKDLYAAYPIDYNLRKAARTGKYNNAVLDDYELQITNPETKQSVVVPIIDRGPAEKETIDVSVGVFKAIGLVDKNDNPTDNTYANVVLVSENQP